MWTHTGVDSTLAASRTPQHVSLVLYTDRRRTVCMARKKQKDRCRGTWCSVRSSIYSNIPCRLFTVNFTTRVRIPETIFLKPPAIFVSEFAKLPRQQDLSEAFFWNVCIFLTRFRSWYRINTRFFFRILTIRTRFIDILRGNTANYSQPDDDDGGGGDVPREPLFSGKCHGRASLLAALEPPPAPHPRLFVVIGYLLVFLAHPWVFLFTGYPLVIVQKAQSFSYCPFVHTNHSPDSFTCFTHLFSSTGLIHPSSSI